MHENAFYEYGIPILIVLIVLTPVLGMGWIEMSRNWRRERRRKRELATKAKRQQAAA